ncbi:MAG: hypothetical protein IKQ27_14310 [Lachnospiraceae bacterium]|nr:hypothetical protein [Lachnospiraceae bacterium]
MAKTENQKIESASTKAFEDLQIAKNQREEKLTSLNKKIEDVSLRLAKAEENLKKAEREDFESYKQASKSLFVLKEEKKFYEAQLNVISNGPYITVEEAQKLKSAMAAQIESLHSQFKDIEKQKVTEMVTLLSPLKDECEKLHNAMIDADKLSGTPVTYQRYDGKIIDSWGWFINRVVTSYEILGDSASRALAETFVTDVLKKK